MLYNMSNRGSHYIVRLVVQPLWVILLFDQESGSIKDRPFLQFVGIEHWTFPQKARFPASLNSLFKSKLV